MKKMVVRFARIPHGCLDNRAYEALLQEFETTHTTSWDERELIQKFSYPVIRDMCKWSFLIQSPITGNYVLSFVSTASITYMILHYLKDGFHSFNELLDRLPKSLKCSKWQLRNLIVFLENFHQLQYFSLPGTTYTCLTLDRDVKLDHQTGLIDKQVDALFKLAESVEPYNRYSIHPDEYIDDWKKQLHHVRTYARNNREFY